MGRTAGGGGSQDRAGRSDDDRVVAVQAAEVPGVLRDAAVADVGGEDHWMPSADSRAADSAAASVSNRAPDHNTWRATAATGCQ
jgi:hypothetical protein